MVVWPILFGVYWCNRRCHSNWCLVQFLVLGGRVWLHVAKGGRCVTYMLCKGNVKEDLCKIWGVFFGKSNTGKRIYIK